MRSLSPTLLAAQRGSSARPYLRLRLFDFDIGAARMRWQRWYTGSESDGPAGVAVAADGALLRARVDPGTDALSHQRVAAPTASSDFSVWSSLGTVAAGPRIGLAAAAGGRALLASVRGDGVSVEVRESTDDGVSFGAGALLVTAAGTVTVVSVSLAPDGSAAVCYAQGAVVRAVTRSGLGSWSAPAAWTLSLAAVSGLAGYFDADHYMLVSGDDAAGDRGCWVTALGAGGVFPPGQWRPLTELALAAGGTGVSYLATGLAWADLPRAALVESFAGIGAGAGAFDRAQLAAGVATVGASSFVWRDPLPFDYLSAHGLAVAFGSTDGWLASPHGVWHAAPSFDAIELGPAVREAELRLRDGEGRLRVILDDADGSLAGAQSPTALAPRGELQLDVGYHTPAGAESASWGRYWITSLRRRRAGGRATVELEASDAWGLLDAWTAPRQLTWPAGSATALAIVSELAHRAGLGTLAAGTSAEAGALQPAFTVRPGESGRTAARRLLARLVDRARADGLELRVREPRASDAPVADFGPAAGEYQATELLLRERPARLARARVFGAGAFAEVVDAAALDAGSGTAIVVDDALDAQPRAEARAATELRRSTLASVRAELTALPHAGVELGDVVSVTDAALGLDAEALRVAEITLRFARGRRGCYEMTLVLGER